jgi:tetratricopeptide (TPR) repeat protein
VRKAVHSVAIVAFVLCALPAWAATKPDKPLTVFVAPSPDIAGSPRDDKTQKEVSDSVRDLKNALQKRKDWFRPVEDRAEAEMTIEVVKRDYEKGHGFVIQAKMGLLDMYDVDIVGQGGLDQYDFTIWRTAAADIVTRVEAYYTKNFNELQSARTRAPRPDAVRAVDRGDEFLKQQKLDDAIREYDAALKTSPQYARAHYNRALALVDRKEYDKAIADLNDAIRLRPTADAYYLRGKSYTFTKEREKAIADLTEALRLDARLPYANFRRATAYFDMGDFDKAIADYTIAIRINPQDAADAYYNRGVAYARKGQDEEAIADYNEVLRTKVNDADTLYLRANAYARRGNTTAALSDYSRAIQGDSKNGFAWYRRGMVFLDTKEWDKSIADFTEALRLDASRFPDAYFLRGNAYLQRGLIDQAIADYTEAVRIDPKDATAYYNRGLAYSRKGIADKAQADRRKALELDPNLGKPK